MGFRNPFRFAVNQKNGRRLRRRLLAGRRARGSRARARGHRPVDDRRPAGQLRLAVLHVAEPPVRRLRLHAGCGAVRRGVQLQRADQRLAQQHRPAPAAAGRAARRLVLVQRGGDLFPELFVAEGEGEPGNGIGPMGGPSMQYDAPIRSALRWPRAFGGRPLFYEWTRDYAKVFELNRRNGDRLAGIHDLLGERPAHRRVAERGARQPDGHGVRSGERALHARVRHGLLRGAARGPARAGGLRARGRVHAGRAGVGDAVRRERRAARGRVLERRHGGRQRATGCPTRGTSSPTGPWTRVRRTRRTPTRRAASSRPRCG